MLIPSIDIQAGRAVQLRQGREFVLDCGDPRALLEQFAPYGEVAIIDLDAAKGEGSNAELIRSLLPLARCRVGGGIRTVENARAWLDAGACRVIIGTAAEPSFLKALPRERVIAAVDGTRDDVLVQGWQRGTGESIEAKIARLRPWVGGFLVTFVETEGTLGGFDHERARLLAEAAGDRRITFAGGIVQASEIARLDAIGADAQVGMAIYTGQLDPVDAVWALVRSDRPDGLVPTAVCDVAGRLLMLAYSDRESLGVSLRERRGVYRSRQRGLWRKGETSGHIQHLRSVELDCDRDTLRFTVEPCGPTCHTGAATCFGPQRGIAATIEAIQRAKRELDAGALETGSYTLRLLRDPRLLRAKVIEEANELVEAANASNAPNAVEDRDQIVWEAADLVYFALVSLIARGASWDAVEAELDRRRGRVTRRGGDRKDVSES